MQQKLPSHGWVLNHYRIGGAFDMYETSLPIDEEVWLTLHAISEIRDRGLAVIRTRQPGLTEAEHEPAWRIFRAYVRQAEVFYRGSVSLGWKSAPLNYYYAFLNLAKALLSAAGKLPPGKVHHGLALAPPSRHGLDQWRAVVQDGVFGRLYEHWMGESLPRGTILDVTELLGYCHPIGLQCAQSGRAARSFYGFSVVVFDDIGGRAITAVPAAVDISHHPTLGPKWNAVYHEIERPKNFAKEVFELHAVASAPLQFFEQTATIPYNPNKAVETSALLESLSLALPNAVEPVSRDDKSQFVLNLPLRIGADIHTPMNDLMATYVVMFCLSNLVRYWPEQLDYAGETNDGWLVESFVKSTPMHFLRLMLSPLLGRTIVFRPSS